MAIRLFVSVGSAYTEKQREFVDSVIEWLKSEGVEPMVLGKTVYPDKQPLKVIQETMSECDGTLVLAFERIFVSTGEEKRGGMVSTPLKEQIIPTVWNQIETAMAYGLSHPILVLAEDGARREGLLEDKFEWLVLPIRVEKATVETALFKETLRKWFARLRDFHEKRVSDKHKLEVGIDPAKMPLVEVLRHLKANQLWACFVALTVMVSIAFGLGRWLGIAMSVRP